MSQPEGLPVPVNLQPFPARDDAFARDVTAAAEAAASDGATEDELSAMIELGVRSYNCLKRAGVQTVGDLVHKTRSELNAIPNFGQKSIEEVIETLHSRGLDLSQD